jgi:quercetin dioxygenase-like cupin family protein
MVARPTTGAAPATKHATDILFTYVMSGEMTLHGEGKEPYRLSAGDAFVIPPGFQTQYCETTANLELLEVTLPGTFTTTIL